MKGFEYVVDKHPPLGVVIERAMEERERQGWELVGITYREEPGEASGRMVLAYRRPAKEVS